MKRKVLPIFLLYFSTSHWVLTRILGKHENFCHSSALDGLQFFEGKPNIRYGQKLIITTPEIQPWHFTLITPLQSVWRLFLGEVESTVQYQSSKWRKMETLFCFISHSHNANCFTSKSLSLPHFWTISFTANWVLKINSCPKPPHAAPPSSWRWPDTRPPTPASSCWTPPWSTVPTPPRPTSGASLSTLQNLALEVLEGWWNQHILSSPGSRRGAKWSPREGEWQKSQTFGMWRDQT